ncbi:MAG: hypothetical protein M3486_05685 [Actinomycetota bacterium]|nr:hypothetical protein [Actinomycetota bacterium]
MAQHGAVTLPAVRAPFPVTAPHPAPRCAVLADAVDSMGAEARRYKGNTSIADDLVRWLRARVS